MHLNDTYLTSAPQEPSKNQNFYKDEIMSTQPLISVVVPTYERPEMTHLLIKSFQDQDYPNKELVISDDSRSDVINDLVARLNDQRLNYIHNPQNLGYESNLLACLERARGQFIVVLGDDDAFCSKNALSRYTEVFQNNPDVDYVYSNQLQFNNALKVDYIFRYFKEDTKFLKGNAAMQHIWTTSIFIPGIGLRAGVPFRQFYPIQTMLFPQLELVGNVINLNAAYGIADVLVAGRAHDEQLGFYASKGERIKGTERHGTVELFDIFERLKKQYGFDLTTGFLENDLVCRYRFMVLKEKMLLGNKRMSSNFHGFLSASPKARRSYVLKVCYIIAICTPSPLLRFMRWIVLAAVKFKNRDAHAEFVSYLHNISPYANK